MTEPYTTIRRFPFELVDTISPGRNYSEATTNLLFVSPELYSNILKTEKNVAVSLNKKFSTCVARHSSARG